MFEEAPVPAPVMAPPVPAAPVAPATATEQPITFEDESGISFDEEEDTTSFTANDQQELSALFDDDEEVQNQREIQAAELEQKARELGNYGPQPAARTASDGARKLGAVTRTASNKDEDELAALWAGNELA
jgi:DNA polymerase II large subunit